MSRLLGDVVKDLLPFAFLGKSIFLMAAPRPPWFQELHSGATVIRGEGALVPSSGVHLRS